MAAATSRTNDNSGRIATAASNISSENQSLISEIRKTLGIFKSIGVDLEREGNSNKVKKLDEAVLELLGTYDDCALFSEAIENMSTNYQPSNQPTNFRKVLEDEVAKMKASSSSDPQSNPLYRQFKEAIWNVSHAGEPMPGEEQEDIVMTSTQLNILNVTCPLTGKPVLDLTNPVRCMDCKHIYEKEPIMHYIRTKNPPRCPMAGCPKVLKGPRVVCDPLLRVDLDELRLAQSANVRNTVIEDFTDLDDE